MTARENRPAADHESKRYVKTLDIYGRVLSIVLMLFGLRQWGVIVGVADSPGGAFETMSVAWQLATMYLAVVDLVASVGMWMRVAWGNVLWICAALSEIAFHTIFMNTFGSDFTVVAFHLFAIGGFATLVLLARKERDAWPFKRR
jgi:hypothetical protein